MTERVRDLTGSDAAFLISPTGDGHTWTTRVQGGTSGTDLTGVPLAPETAPIIGALTAAPDEATVSLDLSTVSWVNPGSDTDWGPVLAVRLRLGHRGQPHQSAGVTFGPRQPPLAR